MSVMKVALTFRKICRDYLSLELLLTPIMKACDGFVEETNFLIFRQGETEHLLLRAVTPTSLQVPQSMDFHQRHH